MRRPFRLLKLVLISLVLLASSFRPGYVCAQSSIKTISTLSHILHLPVHPKTAKNSLINRSQVPQNMFVMDKEKVDAVCVSFSVQKNLAFLEPHFLEKSGTTVVLNPLWFQSPILRI